jgi:hypothetical protein
MYKKVVATGIPVKRCRDWDPSQGNLGFLCYLKNIYNTEPTLEFYFIVQMCHFMYNTFKTNNQIHPHNTRNRYKYQK